MGVRSMVRTGLLIDIESCCCVFKEMITYDLLCYVYLEVFNTNSGRQTAI